MAGGIWEPNDFDPEPPPRGLGVALLLVAALILAAWAALPYLAELVGSP